MGASLTNDIVGGSQFTYFNFDPPTNLSNISAYSQTFSQDNYSFTIIHIDKKNITMIYLIKMHGLSMESYRKNQNIQFRFIFDFHYFLDHNGNKHNSNNQFNFKTSAVFSFNHPFILIPNLTIPFKFGTKYIDDDESDFTIFTSLKNIIKIPFYIIPKTYDVITSSVSKSSTKLQKLLFSNNKKEKCNLNKNDKINPEIFKQQIEQIEHKKTINEQELHILQKNFHLDDTNQIPYVGIENLGLTCYISSALNFLSSVTPFVDLVLNTKAKPKSTSFELQKIFVQLKMASIVAAKNRKRKNQDKNKQTKINKNNNNNKNNKQTKENNIKNSDQTKSSKNNKNDNNNNDDDNRNKENLNLESKNEDIKNNSHFNVDNKNNKNDNKNDNNADSIDDNINNDSLDADSKNNKKINNSNNETNIKSKNNKTENAKDNSVNDEEEEEEEDGFEEEIIPVHSAGRHFSSISILSFVSSFGKNLNELVFNEQDTQEFITILFDKIDSELGKEFAEKRKRIFGVTLINFIRCKKADFGSEIIEESNDISLPIIGNCTSITKSLDKITSKEQMKGDNMWDTGDSKLGKQEVVRFMKFKRLPPFLTFHLLRYTQNEYTMACEELNSYFDCPTIIDMKKYIFKNDKESKYNGLVNNDKNNSGGIKNGDLNNENINSNLDDSDDNDETQYKLMAIVAHRGSLHSGHYVSYMSPNVNDRWFLFNDSLVSESSIKEVQETYGKSAVSTLFGVSSIFHQSSNFYSYLVGYVRLDYIKKIRYGITAPAKIIPNTLVMKYSAIITDLSNISDQIEDDALSSTNSNSEENLPVYHKTEKQIYGKGEKVKWSDVNETIKDIIMSSEIILDQNDTNNDFKTTTKEFFNNNQIYATYPHTHHLFGPLQANSKASDYILNGLLVQFIIIKKINDPVFVCKKNELVCIENRYDVFKKFNTKYFIQYEKRIITEKVFEFPVGAVINLISRDPFTLKIRGEEFEVSHTTTYQSIQDMIAKKIIESKDDQNRFKFKDDFESKYFTFECFNGENEEGEIFDSLSRRIVLYHNDTPLKPKLNETAGSLHKYDDLDFRVLPRPATVNSLNMFAPISLIVVDPSYIKHTLSGVWLPRNDATIKLFEWSTHLSSMFTNLNTSYSKSENKNGFDGFVLSIMSRNNIKFLIDQFDDFDLFSEFQSSEKIRLDIVEAKIPQKIEDYEPVIEKYGRAGIEVRTVLFERLMAFNQYSTVGFFYFTKSDTYSALIKKVVKADKNLKSVITQDFKIETECAHFRGFNPKNEANVFESLQKIKNNMNFHGQRPILTIKIHKNPTLHK